MVIKRIAVSAIAFLFAALSSASAQRAIYAHEHPAACADAWAKKEMGRFQCGSQDFCAAHKNDDRTSALICDPYESKADPKLDSILLSGAWLDAARDLKDMEPWTDCVASDVRDLHPCAMVAEMERRVGTTGDGLLPAGMKTARLALRAHIQVYNFAATVVRLGIGPGRVGLMDVTWSRDGIGRRETHSARLAPAEIDRLLAAINRSDFWRLSYLNRHLGPIDGEGAAVELSIAGHKKQMADTIGDAEAADLSILGACAACRLFRCDHESAPLI
jgi:hypothetical protein